MSQRLRLSSQNLDPAVGPVRPQITVQQEETEDVHNKASSYVPRSGDLLGAPLRRHLALLRRTVNCLGIHLEALSH
jgi:hypothetical protein